MPVRGRPLTQTASSNQQATNLGAELPLYEALLSNSPSLILDGPLRLPGLCWSRYLPSRTCLLVADCVFVVFGKGDASPATILVACSGELTPRGVGRLLYANRFVCSTQAFSWQPPTRAKLTPQ